ncbi:MAG: hypothetical protein JNK82_08430, partial [Myxococcaceae bacterium]|nr:hypothetical protein [Myxococcaceae bacterium]
MFTTTRTFVLAAALFSAGCINVGDVRTSCMATADCREGEVCCSNVCTPGGCGGTAGGGSAQAGGSSEAGGSGAAGGGNATAGGSSAGGS